MRHREHSSGKSCGESRQSRNAHSDVKGCKASPYQSNQKSELTHLCPVQSQGCENADGFKAVTMANKKAPRNTLPGEVWMDIPFSNGDYSISSLGRIYNNRYTRFITPSIGNSGYQYVFIYKKHFFVHRLLAHSFLGMEIDSSMVINHIDGIKTHNELTNIELSTPFLNARHAFVNGLSPTGRCFDRRKLGDVPRRLRHFVDDVLKISHVNFEQATGISRRILYEKTNKIEAKTMKKLTSAYPLNPDWVRYGTGDMLL